MTITPTSLRIVGREFEVKMLDEYEGQVGGVDHPSCTINIKSGQQKLLEADTILHEAVHVLDEIFQLGLTERHVYCLTGGIIALLRDNPELVKYLQDAIANPRNV
jgi:hypothetical protein